MVETRNECIGELRTRGIVVGPREAEKAFRQAVWADRRRGRGGTQK